MIAFAERLSRIEQQIAALTTPLSDSSMLAHLLTHREVATMHASIPYPWDPDGAYAAATIAELDRQMRRLVEETLAAGIIPVLSTFSYSPAQPDWFQAVRFNTILVEIAEDDLIPLINLWAAARALPYQGITEDPLHMTNQDEGVIFDGHESEYGVSLHNLLTLCTLDELYHAVIIDAENDATGT